MVFTLMFFVALFLLPQAQPINNTCSIKRKGTISRRTLREFTAFFIVFIIAAIRYGIGTDYFYTYAPGFIRIRDTGAAYSYYEPAFSTLNIVCTWISDNYQILFVVTSLIIYGILFWLICKISDNPCLSWFVYFCSSLFFSSLSNIRQAIAMILCLVSFAYYLGLFGKERYNPKKSYVIRRTIIFYAISVLAYMFHSSAIVFFAVPLIGLLKRVKLKNQIAIAILLAVVAIGMNYTGITQNILKSVLLALNRYQVYSSDNEMFWSFLLLNACIYALMYISSLHFNGEENNKPTGVFYINVQYVAVIILLFSNVIPLADRLSKYFMICQCLSVPYFVSNIKDKKTKKSILAAFVILYTLWILFYIFVYGADGCFPYKCFFFEDMWEKTYFGF